MASMLVHKPVSKYRCSQGQLYIVCILGWESFKHKIDAFAEFKAFYTLEYAEQRLAEIEAARNIPFFQARNEVSERLRALMVEKADQCVNKWQSLKRYIMEAYPEVEHKSKLEAAGKQYYKQSAFYNWDVLLGLLRTASQFVEDRSAQLHANNNMPAGFKAQIDQLMEEMTQLFLDFEVSLGESKNVTYSKINANNDIFLKLMKMFRDGQHIFRHEPGIRPQFIFTSVLSHVRKKAAEENPDGEKSSKL